MRHHLFVKTLLLLVTLALISACKTPGPPVTMEPAAVISPINETNKLGAEITTARQNQLDILSPEIFAQAEKYYLKAKAGVEKGSDPSDIFEYIGDSRSNLQKAEETAKIARTMLGSVIESRTMARAAGAPKIGKDYDGVEEDFLSLTQAIEKNNIKYTKKNAAGVEEAYRKLELRAIKIETIGEVRSILEKAEKDGVTEYAPESFALAKKMLDDTDQFISQNPYAKQEMLKMAQEDLFMARRAISLADHCKSIGKMQPEEIALYIDDTLHMITTQLGTQDMRDQKFSTQVDNILNSTESLKNDLQFLTEKLNEKRAEFDALQSADETRISALNQQIAFLEGKTKEEQVAKEKLLAEQRATEQKLVAERKFNQLFTTVQNSFDANEAEVYKKGDQLVIRLKGIQFPIGQAVIMPANYLLLSKAQRAIQSFDKPSVVIEGHTDSTGTYELNKHLSQQRAEAVRDYLIANQTLPADKVIALGYGPDRPLASNATPDGRAINRRIDIILSPGSTPGQ